MPPVPHMFSSLKILKGKFIGPSLEALTKKGCSDACDAEYGLQLLLTEKFPFDGKADSPLSAESTRLSSNPSLGQVIAVSWIHQTLADHFASPTHLSFLLVSARSPLSLSLSLSLSSLSSLSSLVYCTAQKERKTDRKTKGNTREKQYVRDKN